MGSPPASGTNRIVNSLRLRIPLILAAAIAAPAAAQTTDARTVIFVNGSDASLLLGATTHATTSRFGGVLLIDTPAAQAANRRFLDEVQRISIPQLGVRNAPRTHDG